MHMQGKIGASPIGQLGIDRYSLPDILLVPPPKRKERTGLLGPSIEGHDGPKAGKEPL